MPEDPESASAESEAGTKEPLDQRLKRTPDEQIAALRERVVFFKEPLATAFQRKAALGF